jgi:acylphosphatase
MHGDVHGVGFRFLVKQKAQALGLKGVCTVMENNGISIDVEGNENSLDEFLIYIQKGVSPLTINNAFEIEFFEELIGYTFMESDVV